MKLLIEIPEEIYQEAIKSGYSHLYDEEVANAVANGKPLDSVFDEAKAEIAQEITCKPMEMWDYRMGLTKALDIIDKCREEKVDETVN